MTAVGSVTKKVSTHPSPTVERGSTEPEQPAGSGGGVTTEVVTVAELFDGCVSRAAELTDAVFDKVPAIVGTTEISTLAEPKAGIGSTVHVMVCDPEHLATSEYTLGSVVPAGSESVNVTDSATSGPQLVTVNQ